MALERIEPDGSPTRPFPLHLRNTGQGWSTLTVYEGGFSSVVRRTPALPTAPSARSGVPVKHAADHQSPFSSSDDEPPKPVSGEPPQFLIAWTDYMGGMVREFERKVTQGPLVLCAGLAGYGAHCINNAAEVNNRRLKDQRKAEADTPPVPIVPIPELDTKRLVLSKVSHPHATLGTIVTQTPAAVSRTAQPQASTIQDSTAQRRKVYPSISAVS